MSSADRCRVALPSRISRIFRRGSVTFSPALRRSLPSTASSPANSAALGIGCAGFAIRYHRRPLLRIFLSYGPPCDLKVTLPRLKILEILEGSATRHLSAEDIYRTLLESNEDIGLATVYRVLTQFEAAGLVT